MQQNAQSISVSTLGGLLKALPISGFEGAFVSECGRVFRRCAWYVVPLPKFKDAGGVDCVRLDGVAVRVPFLAARELDPSLIAARERDRALWRHCDVKQRRARREKRKRKAWAAAGIVDEFE